MGEPGTAPAPPGARRGAAWLAFLLLCPVFWWGCWGAPFFGLDDAGHIATNPTLQAGAPWSDIWFGGKAKDVDCFYLPLTDSSFRLDRIVYVPLLQAIVGENAWAAGIRTTSVILHILAAVMVWLLARQLGLSPPWAGFTAALFAIHPIHCNTVCWCVERKTILAAVFGFAALLLYVRARSWRGHALATFLYACALLSKAAALGLLPVLVVWELLGRPTLATDTDAAVHGPEARGTVPGLAKRIPRVALQLLPWIVLSAGALRINLYFVEHATLPPPGGSLWTALLTDVGVLWRYVLNLLWPARLSMDYALPVVVSPADARLWLYGLALAGVVAVTILLAERGTRRFVCFAWLWFVGALGPALNFVGKNNLMSDCYVYYSAPAFWLAVALALRGALRRLAAAGISPPQRPWLAPAALAVLLVPLTAATASRSALYGDSLRLMESSARNEPRSALNHLILAQALHGQAEKDMAGGDVAAAAACLRRELVELEAGVAGLNFDRSLIVGLAYGFLGESYYSHGRLDEAEAMLRKALTGPQPVEGEPKSRAFSFLGLVAVERKQYEQALQCFEQACRLTPQKTKPRIYRAKVLLLLQKEAKTSAEAWRCYRAAKEALEAVPASSPFYPHVEALLKTMRPPEGKP